MDQDYSPVQHTIVLRRIDPQSNAAQFYMLTLERDLFGNVVVTRQWGRVGTAGRQITQPYPTMGEAVEAMTVLAAAKRKRGYVDLWRARLTAGRRDPLQTSASTTKY